MENIIKGHISQIIGPVIDISFEAEGEDGKAVKLPAIHDSVTIKRQDGRTLVAEIQQHIGENCVRSVAMDSTDGLRRGMEAVSQYAPIRVPVGDQAKGRLLNVIGDTIDGMEQLDRQGA